MRPLNINKKTGAGISSNTVIWNGPKIPCLILCKGDTITDVTYKLATKFCNLMDALNVSNYDISCLNITTCPPETFQELMQAILDRFCSLGLTSGPAGANGNYLVTSNEEPSLSCPNGGTRIELFNGVTNVLINTYFVCNGLNGTNGTNGLNGVDGGIMYTYFKSLPVEFNIQNVQGFPFLSGGTFTIPNNITTEVTDLTTTITQAGNYIAEVEFGIDAGNPNSKWFGYELRKNGILIPYSTRVGRVLGGTPGSQMVGYSCAVDVQNVNSGDIISLHISNIDNSPPSTSFSLVLFGGSLHIHSR